MEFLRRLYIFHLCGVCNLSSVFDDAVKDVNGAVRREMDKAALVIGVSADEKVADAVQHQAQDCKGDAGSVSIRVELLVVIDVIFVVDMEKRLNDFHDD